MIAALALQLVLAQEPTLAFAPLEEALAKLSFGPTFTAAGLVDREGVGANLAVGFQLAVFDVERVPEPRCAEHHARERSQLGAKEGEPLDDFFKRVQQQCPAIAEKTKYDFSLGGETALVLHKDTSLEGVVRTYAGGPPLKVGDVGLQFLLAMPFRTVGGELNAGFRMGLELTWFIRFKSGNWRPVLQPFARGEATLIRRDAFADQATFGVRFLFDL